MEELKRQRNARDLWVSRGHLYAMAAGTLVLSLTTFVLGYTIGRDRAPEAPTEVAVAVGDEPLVELLARVEASARPHGGVDALTFPDALEGTPALVPGVAMTDAGPVLPIPPPVISDAVPVVAEPGNAPEPVGDATPSGSFTVEVSRFEHADDAVLEKQKLRAAGLDAWIGLAHVDGRPVHRVSIAGYADEPAATAALPDVAAKVRSLGLTAAPTVMPIR